jgi:hypothetical protein
MHSFSVVTRQFANNASIDRKSYTTYYEKALCRPTLGPSLSLVVRQFDSIGESECKIQPGRMFLDVAYGTYCTVVYALIQEHAL